MKTLRVHAKPGARVSELQALSDGTYQARLKAPPVDGKANAELIALVASHLKLRKSQVSIKSGAASRLKLVLIDD